MRRYRAAAGPVFLVFATAVLAATLSIPATAQTAAFQHQVGVQAWFAQGSSPGATWTSTLWHLEYAGVHPVSPFGLSAAYLGGGGRGETFWTVGASYRLPLRSMAAGTAPPVVRVKAEYGSFRFNVPGGQATSAGVGFGLEAALPLGAPGGGRLALVADYSSFGSNATTAPLGSGAGPVSTYTIALVYKPVRAPAQGPAPGVIYAGGPDRELMGEDWAFTAGARSISAEVPFTSRHTWTGFFIGVRKSF
jgi:hypothetical protein